MKDSDIFDVIVKDVGLLKVINLKDLHHQMKSSRLFAAYWLGEENKWMFDGEVDPLSAVLLVEQKEPYREGDDDIAVGTLANMFGRKPNWVKSFQLGLTNKTNSGTSISGFLMGVRIKQKLCTLFPEKALPSSATSSKSDPLPIKEK